MPGNFPSTVGTLFDRLSTMRTELGEPAYERTLRHLCQTLGACALKEAEYRASILGARQAARDGLKRPTPMSQRRSDDDWPYDADDR